MYHSKNVCNLIITVDDISILVQYKNAVDIDYIHDTYHLHVEVNAAETHYSC